MSAEEILIKLGLDATSMERGLRHAKEQMKEAASSMKGELMGALAGVAGAEAFKELIDSEIEFGEKTIDLAHRLGISTDAVQVWDFALKRNGSTVEAATGFFEKLAANRDKALGGGEEGAKLTKDFKELGVSIEDLKGKRIEEIAEQIGEIFQAGGDPQKLIGALKEIGGKGAGDMVATLRDGIREAREEAEKLGIIVDNGTLQKLKEAGDRAGQFGAQLKAAFAPWISSMVEGLQFLFTIIKSEVAFLSATFGALKEHPTKVGDALKAGAEAQAKVFDDAEEADKALMRKQSRDAQPLKGGSDVEDPEKEAHKKAGTLNKEAKGLEDKAAEKQLSLASQIAMLHLKRNRLQEEFDDKTKNELDHAQARLDLAKNGVELQEKLNERKAKEAEITKKIAEEKESLAYKTRERSEDFHSASYSTVHELATNGNWQGFGGVVSRSAQQVEWLEADSKAARAKGNFGRSEWDEKEARGRRDWLEKQGIVKPDRHLESIDEEIKKLNSAITRDGIALKDIQ